MSTDGIAALRARKLGGLPSLDREALRDRIVKMDTTGKAAWMPAGRRRIWVVFATATLAAAVLLAFAATRDPGETPSATPGETPGLSASLPPIVPLRPQMRPSYIGDIPTHHEYARKIVATHPRIEPSEFAELFDAHVALPATIAGGVFEGLYDVAFDDDDAMMFHDAVYSNDVIISITRLRKHEEAIGYLNNHFQNGFSDFTTRVDVNGVLAHAIPHLDIPPVRTDEPLYSADGTIVAYRVKRGTGLANGTARVSWAAGKFVIAVTHPDMTVAQLTEVARAITFTPRSGVIGSQD